MSATPPPNLKVGFSRCPNCDNVHLQIENSVAVFQIDLDEAVARTLLAQLTSALERPDTIGAPLGNA